MNISEQTMLVRIFNVLSTTLYFISHVLVLLYILAYYVVWGLNELGFVSEDVVFPKSDVVINMHF